MGKSRAGQILEKLGQVYEFDGVGLMAASMAVPYALQGMTMAHQALMQKHRTAEKVRQGGYGEQHRAAQANLSAAKTQRRKNPLSSANRQNVTQAKQHLQKVTDKGLEAYNRRLTGASPVVRHEMST